MIKELSRERKKTTQEREVTLNNGMETDERLHGLFRSSKWAAQERM